MKNTLRLQHLLYFFLISIFNFTNLYSQDILWEKSYGGKHAEYLFDVIPTPDYGFILAGSSLSQKTGNKKEDNRGNLDYWVWKMDEKGEPDWQKSLGSSGQDKLQSIILTNDGGFLLAGSSDSKVVPIKDVDEKDFLDGDRKSVSRGESDFWIIKLNAKGGEEWQKTMGGSGQDELTCAMRTKDGGFVLGGSSSSGISGEKTQKGYGGLDYWVIKINSEGKLQWQQTFGGEYNDELRSISSTHDGGFVLGGSSNSTDTGTKTQKNIGESDYWIIKLDKEGNEQWQKTLGGKGDDQLHVVHTTSDGNYILAGNTNSESGDDKRSTNQSGTDFWVFKIDKDTKEILWQETYNIANVDILTSLVENDDRTLLLGGYAQGEAAEEFAKSRKAINGTDDYVAIKTNEKGEELWRKSIGSDGQDILRRVIETRDGGYLMAGTSNSKAFPNSSGEGSSNELIKGLSFSNEENQDVKNIKNDINQKIGDTSDEVNQKIKGYTGDATTAVNNTLGIDKDSPLKLGPTGASPLNLSKIGDGAGGGNPLSGLGGNPFLRGSGDKSKSFGNSDFWVVKLKDKQKPKEDKKSIEAIPNPTTQFTNVIVGYEYTKGTATLVDLSGHILQSFSITERTIPIDLQGLPEGIYVVNIKTDKGSEGVKIIKQRNKN